MQGSGKYASSLEQFLSSNRTAAKQPDAMDTAAGAEAAVSHDPNLVAIYEKQTSSAGFSAASFLYRHPQASSNRSHPEQAWETFYEWNHSLFAAAGRYTNGVSEQLEHETEILSELEITKLRDHLHGWLKEQVNLLAEGLKQAPPGIAKKIMEAADANLRSIRERLWNEVLQATRQYNLTLPQVPPVQSLPNPSRTHYPSGSLFDSSLRNERFEVGLGLNKAVLSFRNSSSVKKEDSLFYVVDALGRKKAVTLTFFDSRLEKDFKERFSKSSLKGAEVSLEKFMQFLRSLKRSISNISEVELQRLKSKIYGEQETKKLDAAVADFVALLKRMKK